MDNVHWTLPFFSAAYFCRTIFLCLTTCGFFHCICDSFFLLCGIFFTSISVCFLSIYAFFGRFFIQTKRCSSCFRQFFSCLFSDQFVQTIRIFFQIIRFYWLNLLFSNSICRYCFRKLDYSVTLVENWQERDRKMCEKKTECVFSFRHILRGLNLAYGENETKHFTQNRWKKLVQTISAYPDSSVRHTIFIVSSSNEQKRKKESICHLQKFTPILVKN